MTEMGFHRAVCGIITARRVAIEEISSAHQQCKFARFWKKISGILYVLLECMIVCDENAMIYKWWAFI